MHYTDKELNEIALHMLNAFGGELPEDFNDISVDRYFWRYYPAVEISRDNRIKIYQLALLLVTHP